MRINEYLATDDLLGCTGTKLLCPHLYCMLSIDMSRPDGGMKKVQAHPLSDAEIRKILGPVSILTNRQLGSIEHVDDLFDAQGRCILLYTPHDPTSGHWVCLIRRPDCIEYFDSYGDKPDIADDLGDQPPLLTRLLKEAGMPVFYNTKQFQKERGDVATCGRHVICRLLYAPKSIDQYAAAVAKSGLTPDDFVSGLTYDKLRK